MERSHKCVFPVVVSCAENATYRPSGDIAARDRSTVPAGASCVKRRGGPKPIDPEGVCGRTNQKTTAPKAAARTAIAATPLMRPTATIGRDTTVVLTGASTAVGGP